MMCPPEPEESRLLKSDVAIVAVLRSSLETDLARRSPAVNAATPAPLRFHVHPGGPARTGRAVAATAWLLLVAVACGCDDAAGIRPGDVRTYMAPRSAVLPPTAVAGANPAVVEPTSGPQLRYELPEGWSTAAGASGMRLATVLIGEPADAREVTVIPASGSLRGNVERWQGQLDAEGDPTARAAAVDRALEAAETIEVNGVQATAVLLLNAAATEGEGEAILGAMVPLDDTTALFVKFKGDASVARRERENFSRFVSSLRWD